MRIRGGLVYFVVTIYQANACLDLMVRSFNDVFSSNVETGDGRIRKPHQVDDLTNLYRTDEYGNIIPAQEMVSNQIQSGRGSNDEIENQQQRSEFVADPYTTSSNGSGTVGPNGSDTQTDNFPTPSYNENVSRKRTRYRGAYYIPGRRSMVDLLVKLIESFRLTTTSKFITSRSRYENSRLQ